MAKRGRKREAKIEATTPGRLKSFVDRIIRLLDERDDRNTDVSAVLLEAKGVGYDTAILRKVVRRHRMDADARAKAAEQEALIAAYEQELNMAVELVLSGLSLRAAEKATGVPKSNIHRALAVPAASHDPATGEVLQHATPQPPEPTTHAATAVAAEDGRASSQPEPDGGVPAGTEIDESCGDSGASVLAYIANSPLGPVLTNAPPDDLAIPPFLRGSSRRARGEAA